jgi:hypothetical protein
MVVLWRFVALVVRGSLLRRWSEAVSNCGPRAIGGGTCVGRERVGGVLFAARRRAWRLG